MVFCRSISRSGSDDDLIVHRNQRNESTCLSPRIVLGVMSGTLQDAWLNVRGFDDFLGDF